MIEVNNLVKQYGAFTAVKGINFSIRKGEIVGLLGPNGAGKSTTIRILCGYLQATSGRVHIDGLSVETQGAEVKKKLGYLPEAAPLYQDMLVWDYLNYVAQAREIPKEKIPQRIEEMVALCRLSEVMHKNIGEISKGYRQRVGLAHAIIGDPEILILDEPTAGLDPNQIIEIRKTIKQIGEQKTVLLSSHILPEVEATCSRVIIINQGTVVADGSSAELKAKANADKKIMVEFDDGLEAKGGETLTAAKQAIEQLGFVKEVALHRSNPPAPLQKAGLIVYHSAKEEVRGTLYELIKKQGWPLLTFYETTESFEGVFRALTTQPEATPSAEAATPRANQTGE